MNEYLKIPNDVLDTSISVSIDASLREISSILTLIAVAEQLEIIDISDLSSVYEQIFSVVSEYGYVHTEDNDD